MTQLSTIFEAPLTMSSVEIADLTGKRHDHVMTDIRKMLVDLNLSAPDFSGTQAYGVNNKRVVFNLPKRECLILVSGYNVQLRAKIIDRWQALEAQQPAFAIPKNLPEALLLAAELAQKTLQLEQELKAIEPKVKAFNALAVPNNSLCLRDAAKALQMRPIDLTTWLQENKWIYKRAGTAEWIGYQVKVQTLLLEHKVTTVSRSDGTEKIVTQVRITPKGLTRIGELCVVTA